MLGGEKPPTARHFPGRDLAERKGDTEIRRRSDVTDWKDGVQFAGPASVPIRPIRVPQDRGHGGLAAKLAGFGLRDEGNCTCGVPETAGHVLLECGKYGDLREMGGLELDKMVGKEGYEHFLLLATEILERKELEEWRDGLHSGTVAESGSAMHRRSLVVEVDRNSF
ncbi:hypothetical protein AAG570_004345 [Ranatra chinensis]|uniref:Reverse transcriptase n=1 Tax=Ranatra chinensis TaxID=642074 RepID=A0ABD0Y0K5_9HEMI